MEKIIKEVERYSKQLESFLIAVKNWIFCQRFPFLFIKVDWRGDETKNLPFCLRYARTYWDDIPYGWRKAFGWSLIKDIREILVKHNLLDDYEVTQVKEKWGILSWYDNWYNEDLRDCKEYYTELSYNTCINCGKPSSYLSTGWICPYCEDCVNEQLKEQPNKKFKKIYDKSTLCL